MFAAALYPVLSTPVHPHNGHFCINNPCINLHCIDYPGQKLLKDARILTRRRDVHDISPVLIDIHWLPIPLRICYKINLLTFKCLHELRPPYLKKIFSLPISLNETLDQLLQDFLKKMVLNLNLRLMDVVPILLLVQVFWNDLPVDLRFEDYLTCFKSSLKTHLFTLFTKNPDSNIYWYL